MAVLSFLLISCNSTVPQEEYDVVVKDGYVIVNGVKIEYDVAADDVVEVVDGYVVVNGVKTEYEVKTPDVIEVVDGYLVVNGVVTEYKVDSEDVIEVVDGYLVVNGVRTEYAVLIEEDNDSDGYYWSNSQILVQLYENDNKGELSSGLKRYYSGEDDSATADIDRYVDERNAAAEAATKVDAVYDYTTDFAWGGSFNDITTKTKSTSSAAPDVYSNFVYDLTSLALRGCFANLKGTAAGQGNNYFRFNEADYNPSSTSYFDSSKSEGYFYEYMKSLSLANANGEYDKMYCLASDYCLDVVRAFLVMPVNVNMMESIALDEAYKIGDTADLNGDGKFTIADFYQLVWNGDWTYDALAAYSAIVACDNGYEAAKWEMTDVLGAAFGRSSGLTASGLLYTSSVKIIQNDNGNYYYGETNQDLVEFSNALAKLFEESIGVAAVTAAGGTELGEIAAIRSKFSEGNSLLFGGIIAVGSLEENEYQKLNEQNGFGIVPVPVYQAGDEYLTLVHNLARVVAIGQNTTEFEQCTAFLNYQSTNSAKILNAYYNDQLVAAVAEGGAGEQNVEMLEYIRNHVRDCFDKTYEDVISACMLNNGDQDANYKRWHQIIYFNGYVVHNMATLYGDYYYDKAAELTTIVKQWNSLK